MPLQRLNLTPGVNKDNTPTTGKGGWYETEKVRFKNGLPEKIGGWVPLTQFRTIGTARGLCGWVALDNTNLLGIGTDIKYYIEYGGTLEDITPIRRESNALSSPLDTESGSNRIIVNDPAHGAISGSYITIYNAVDVGGVPAAEINKEHEVELIDPNSYYIFVDTQASSTTNGGGTIDIEYQTNRGLNTYVIGNGWGASPWGEKGWGSPAEIGIGQQLVLWNHDNFGQTLIYGQRGGPLFKWDPTIDKGKRGTKISGTEVPLSHDALIISDVSRFVIVFGTNEIGQIEHDPLLIRWSDQEDYQQWMPSITNQAGSIRVSEGSYIVTALQTKQEMLVWTDSALYSMRHIGGPFTWSIELQMNNLSIISPRAATTVSNLVFWMGQEKFYVYTGRVDPLSCPISTYIFKDINISQSWQIFAATNERFNEVWWFYCSKDSIEIDRYVIFNYVENVWAHGTMSRTAWIEAAGRTNPIATTQDGQILYHEYGTDDETLNHSQAIESYALSSDIDIGEGEHMGFVWRMIPDISFIGSSASSPRVELELRARKNPGLEPWKESGGEVRRNSALPVEQFTEYVYTRIRGRQMAMRISSNQRGVHWRLGTPRIDIKPDGRKM